MYEKSFLLKIIFHHTDFSACKTAQDDSVALVDSCKEQPKCGGAANKEEAEKLLKALTP